MMEGQPSDKRRRWWRWPLIGCGIGLGIVVAMAIAMASCLVIAGLVIEESVKEVFEPEEIASSLSLGDWVTADGLKLIVDRYEIADGSELSAPSPGAQFLWIHVAAQNVGDVPIEEFVRVRIEYRGVEVSSSNAYDPAHPGFESFNLQLFPGVGREGWIDFEVPVGLDLSEVTVLVEVGVLPEKVASWRLIEPGNADEH